MMPPSGTFYSISRQTTAMATNLTLNGGTISSLNGGSAGLFTRHRQRLRHHLLAVYRHRYVTANVAGQTLHITNA